MKHSAVVAILFLASCRPEPASNTASPSPLVHPQATFKVGDLDKDGRLIFWSINAFDHNEPFILHKDKYGVVLYNDGSEDHPVARYILAFQSTREIVHTSDFTTFRQALTRVPRGSIVGSYDTCSISRAYGLPSSVVSQFEKALSEAGVKVEEDGRIVCYCPNRW